MGTPINWSVNAGDPILENPFYQKYSRLSFADLALQAVVIKADINTCLASREAAPIVAYLSWLLRVVALVA